MCLPERGWSQVAVGCLRSKFGGSGQTINLKAIAMETILNAADQDKVTGWTKVSKGQKVKGSQEDAASSTLGPYPQTTKRQDTS